MAEDTDLLELVSGFYDAALDPARWDEALERLADHLNALFGHLFYVRPDSGETLFATASARAPPTGLIGYHEHYESIDPRRPAGHTLPAGVVAPDWSLVLQETFLRSEFYNDYYAPLGLRWMLAGFIEKDPSFSAGFALTRGLRDQPFTEDEARCVESLLPHIRRAVLMHRTLAESESRDRAQAAALERLRIGALLLDESGRPVLVNRAARAILERNDGLALTRRGLRAARPAETAALEAAVRRALATTARRGQDAGGLLQISRPSLRRPLLVVVSPLPLADDPFDLGRRAGALVLIGDPEARPALPEDELARLYGLTPAEAALAAGLARGLSLAEIAEARGVRRETARWTLKQVLAKTDTRRQADLVRLLLTGPLGAFARIG